MLTIKYQTAFKKDYKRIQKRGYDLHLLEDVITKLAEQKQLEPARQDHALSGNWKDFRECHIAPDWLLIYQVRENELLLVLTRTGTHAELFGL
jgi:mRNA interferase YafQ